MIECQKASGEMWRPRRAGQRGRCWICHQDLVAEHVRKDYAAWFHTGDKPCRPRDGWLLKLGAELAGRGLGGTSPTAYEHGDAVVMLAGGPSPPDDVDALEVGAMTHGRRVVWLVDGRFAATDWGPNHPGHKYPSWLATTPWSAFGQCWLTRGSAQVFIALDSYLGTSWPSDPARCCWFRPEDVYEYEVQRLGGNLAGLPCCFADGRMFTLDGALKAAMVPEATPAVHPLDAPPWTLVDEEWVRAVRTP